MNKNNMIKRVMSIFLLFTIIGGVFAPVVLAVEEGREEDEGTKVTVNFNLEDIHEEYFEHDQLDNIEYIIKPEGKIDVEQNEQALPKLEVKENHGDYIKFENWQYKKSDGNFGKIEKLKDLTLEMIDENPNEGNTITLYPKIERKTIAIKIDKKYEEENAKTSGEDGTVNIEYGALFEETKIEKLEREGYDFLGFTKTEGEISEQSPIIKAKDRLDADTLVITKVTRETESEIYESKIFAQWKKNLDKKNLKNTLENQIKSLKEMNEIEKSNYEDFEKHINELKDLLKRLNKIDHEDKDYDKLITINNEINELIKNGLKPKKIEIEFIENKGSSVSNQYKNEGDKILEPINPSRTNYTFKGWYTDDKTFKNKWNFDTEIKKEYLKNDKFTLFAKWEKDKDKGGPSGGGDEKDYVIVSITDDRGKYLIRREKIEIESRNDTVINVTEDAMRKDKDIRRDYEIKDKKLIAVKKLENNKDYEWVLTLNKKNEGTKGGDIKVRHNDTIEWEYKKIKDDKDKDKDKEKDKDDKDKEESKPSRKGMLNTGYKQAFIEGYPNGKFQPEREVSREEVAQMIYRVLDPATRDNNISNSANFSDVQAGKWSTRPIATLDKLDILTGYKDGTFRPTRGIKRAEVATILARVAELNGSSSGSFNDVAGHWAASDIGAVNNKGWINGYPNGTFKPEKNITRAEFAKMLNSALGRTGSASNDMMNKFTDINTGQWFYDDIIKASNEIFK